MRHESIAIICPLQAVADQRYKRSIELESCSMKICHAAIFAVAFELTGSAALAADANHGAELAKRWCATCHVVSDDQKQAVADVPPFAAVARNPDFSPEKLALFLLDPHPKMPNFPLNRVEAADIAAYIASLRK